ncbi:hypothetical protein DBR43_29355 [Pedobacter sp. KBW06]|uniref:hypothetical protein n=1 Tax=Pedobacter sp. KBW06 TaxID=2153359 RepID=UPI000F59CCDA|nr:hypothetical protein [Pedobacter sp. KBW06]RQO66332.1 hypothetical protein DBR43_29355 [Pedobacter sp. KBW06]
MKSVPLILFSILFSTYLYAQKVPNTQNQSIWAEKIKIDGKLDDWSGRLSAYNQENNLWYSIANDDKFLYLAVKKDKFPAKAYATGGIKLFLSNKETKNTAGLPAFTFPVPVVNGKLIPRDEWNEIDVRDLSGITDTLISIYNEHGIQAGWNIENNGEVYTYELAIPLKLVDIKPGQTIYYNMLLRGNARKRLSPSQAAMYTMGGNNLNPNVSKEMMLRIIDSGNWSEFWASYKLAQKP